MDAPLRAPPAGLGALAVAWPDGSRTELVLGFGADVELEAARALFVRFLNEWLATIPHLAQRHRPASSAKAGSGVSGAEPPARELPLADEIGERVRILVPTLIRRGLLSGLGLWEEARELQVLAELQETEAGPESAPARAALMRRLYVRRGPVEGAL